MPSASRLGDSIAGTTAGEHSGHPTAHSPLPITGNISGNCSGDVFVNGKPAAYVGSITTERDACCGSSLGSVGSGSGSVFINGKPAARVGDSLNATMAAGRSPAAAGMSLLEDNPWKTTQ